MCEGERAVIAEEADKGAKGHGLHPVVDLGDPVPCQRPGACRTLHVGEPHCGLQGQTTQDGLAGSLRIPEDCLQDKDIAGQGSEHQRATAGM